MSYKGPGAHITSSENSCRVAILASTATVTLAIRLAQPQQWSLSDLTAATLITIFIGQFLLKLCVSTCRPKGI